ncbi:MAG: hypothetical protein LGB01_04370 [Sulfurovum sp.]|nr:hypothetical protein [Sulfurovum sp.]
MTFQPPSPLSIKCNSGEPLHSLYVTLAYFFMGITGQHTATTFTNKAVQDATACGGFNRELGDNEAFLGAMLEQTGLTP